jgi:hypothetical protein
LQAWWCTLWSVLLSVSASAWLHSSGPLTICWMLCSLHWWQQFFLLNLNQSSRLWEQRGFIDFAGFVIVSLRDLTFFLSAYARSLLTSFWKACAFLGSFTWHDVKRCRRIVLLCKFSCLNLCSEQWKLFQKTLLGETVHCNRVRATNLSLRGSRIPMSKMSNRRPRPMGRQGWPQPLPTLYCRPPATQSRSRPTSKPDYDPFNTQSCHNHESDTVA